MIVSYLFASPEGDIPLEPGDLSKPFRITPEKTHPVLTLGNYFDSLKACILKNRGELLQRILKDGRHWRLEDVWKIKIRSEKHGILYHLASVEVFMKETRTKFTLSTAISRKGIECLVREHDTLAHLNSAFDLSFLPEIYGIRELAYQTKQGTAEKMVILIAQWFEDYHEWHMAMDPTDGRQKNQIWDLKRGHRYASSTEAFHIFEESSKILALYYDGRDFSRIGAWHHAAGDFIINAREDGGINVRLTTVREYEPLLETENAGPMIAMVYFFLDTTVRMRLDRLDGVGETVWVDNFAVTATVKGFIEGLRAREIKGNGVAGIRAADLLSLLQSFDKPELGQVFESLLTHYAARGSNDIGPISAHIADHISCLRQALQDFH